jgi:hypothetical protein
MKKFLAMTIEALPKSIRGRLRSLAGPKFSSLIHEKIKQFRT